MSTASTPRGGDTLPEYPWGLALALGLISTIIGVVLLFNIGAAAATLAILTAIALIVAGIGEIALTEERSLWDWLLGGVFVVGGLAALAWPGITLWALALVAGVSLLVAGAGRAVLSIAGRSDTSHWSWKFVGGVVTFFAGVLALSWPGATVFVLAVIFGIRMLAIGVVTLFAAKTLHDMNDYVQPAV